MRTPTSAIKPDTPIRSIRAYCLDCTGGGKAEVRACSFMSCPLHPYRMGKRPPKGSTATPMKTIRIQCKECCSGNAAEVRHCPANQCALHRYRLGRKVPATGELSNVIGFSDDPTMNDTPKQLKQQNSTVSDGL